MLLMPNVLAVNAQGAMGVANVEQLDLAAMALTPVDLDDLGFVDYVIADGRSQTLEDRVAEQTATGDDPDEIRTFLSDLGWIRGYRSRLAHPVEAGVEDFDALISSGITQFTDEANAQRGWELVAGLDVSSGEGSEIEDAEMIGDESRLIDVGEQSFDGGQMHPGLRIVFRSGVLVGDLIVFGVPGEPLVPADLETLATRQLERMDDVTVDGGPGLSLQVLRWQGDSIADPDIDNYVKLDGDAFIGLGDTKQNIAQAETNFADAIDHYRYEAQLISTLFQYTSVASFRDSDAADAWVSGALDRTELNRPEGAELEEVTDVPTFGDESVVLKITTPVEDGEAVGYAVFAHLGDIGISLAFISLNTLEPDDVIAMFDDQIACFEAGSCAESVPLPIWVNG